uniref:Glutaredoxin domain-containing protein n=1 Tax=Rattus norvegicus TaxID=10116 RepID=A0ABK0M2C1_RAT
MEKQRKLQPQSTAKEYGTCKTQSGKMFLFIEPTFQYCRNTEGILNQLPFKHGLLGFEDITATNNTNSIQDYFQQLTGVRIVPWVFIAMMSWLYMLYPFHKDRVHPETRCKETVGAQNVVVIMEKSCLQDTRSAVLMTNSSRGSLHSFKPVNSPECSVNA